MHYEQGNLYQAVMAFEQAREFLPHDPSVVYNLALALESAGRSDEALDLYYAANSMDQANPIYLGNLVRLRVRLGEHDELLERQLKDLVLIETRPQWRRWADVQLGLTTNLALDRGPETPEFDSSNDEPEIDENDIQDKIIDLTPVVPVSLEEPEDSLDEQLEQSTLELSSPLEWKANENSEASENHQATEDLSEEDYYRAK